MWAQRRSAGAAKALPSLQRDPPFPENKTLSASTSVGLRAMWAIHRPLFSNGWSANAKQTNSLGVQLFVRGTLPGSASDTSNDSAQRVAPRVSSTVLLSVRCAALHNSELA
jgi:hypothetical protein